jgi:hypothetical protein
MQVNLSMDLGLDWEVGIERADGLSSVFLMLKKRSNLRLLITSVRNAGVIGTRAYLEEVIEKQMQFMIQRYYDHVNPLRVNLLDTISTIGDQNGKTREFKTRCW